jgi:outer membrane protein OmpA-like peptidoglycan-associated protein
MPIRSVLSCMALLFALPAYADNPTSRPMQPQAHSGCGLVRVHFDTDSAELSDADKAQLEVAADCLKGRERLRVIVAGNTDNRGSAEHNQALGQRRADAVANFLRARGVSGQQLLTASQGEDQPLCNEDSPECWQRNRRTTMRDACRL